MSVLNMAPDSSFARPGCLPTFPPFWHTTLPSYQVRFADVYALYGLWFFYSQVGSYQHIFYFDIRYHSSPHAISLCVMPTLCVFWFWFLLFRYHEAISRNDQVWSSVYQDSRGSRCWRQIIWIVQLDPCALVYPPRRLHHRGSSAGSWMQTGVHCRTPCMSRPEPSHDSGTETSRHIAHRRQTRSSRRRSILHWEEVCWYVSWLHVWSSWRWSHLVGVENGPGTCSYPN